jgi:hypothetical protein
LSYLKIPKSPIKERVEKISKIFPIGFETFCLPETKSIAVAKEKDNSTLALISVTNNIKKSILYKLNFIKK